jgi:hypothetical protein
MKVDYITKSELLLRTVSLGFDRTGREYWLLDEQNRTLVGGFNQTYSQYIDDEPVLLVREPSINTWSYICTSSVHELLDYFSSKYLCERFLYKNISSKIEKFRENILKINLKSKCSQDQWLAGFRSFEFWFSGIQAMVNNSVNPLDTPRRLKLQELGIARCLEFRVGGHYAFLNKIFDVNEGEKGNSTSGASATGTTSGASTAHDSKKKLSRQKLLENVYDCHSTLGWLRQDSYQRIRELSANTIATKILCDPTMYDSYSLYMRKTPFRKKNLHLDEIGSNPRAYIKPLPSAAAINTRQTTTLLQSRGQSREESTKGGGGGSDDDEVSARHSGSASSKSVEQIHIETGQVLRRWPSGTKAASVLGVSRSGISVCCSGVKDEAFGFRWRFCDGLGSIFSHLTHPFVSFPFCLSLCLSLLLLGNLPPIEEVPIKTLLKMKSCYQKTTGTYVGLDEEDTEDETQPLSKPPTTPVRPRSTPTLSVVPKVAPNIHRQVSDVIGSLVPVPYRLLKLKIELLNMLALLPKGLLSWNNPTPSVGPKSEQIEGTQSGETPLTDQVEKGELPSSPPPLSNPSSDDDEDHDEEEKEAVTGMTVERFIKDIQMCDSCLGLFHLIQLLEKALPPIVLFDYPFQLTNNQPLDINATVSHNTTSGLITTSMVAISLYSLDRWIRYEEIPLDFFYEGVDYRPRLIYSPRCILSPTCMKYFHHHGRCDPAISIGDSRYREILPKGMQVPNRAMGSNQGAAAAAMGGMGMGSNQFQKSLPPPGMIYNLQQQQQQQQMPYGANGMRSSSYPPMGNASYPPMYRPPEAEFFSIDSIQPYVPRKDEIKESEWI